MSTVGKYVLKVTFTAPDRPFLTNLGLDYLGIMDPKSVSAAGSNTCNGLVGSGPFKISSFTPSFATVTLARNPHHTFGPAWAHNKGLPYLSTVNFSAVTSNTTAVSELLAGQLDITDISGDQLSRVQGDKNIKLYRFLSTNVDYVSFNCGKAPFNDLAVRRAVAEALNRKALLTAGAQGLGKVATSWLPPVLQGYDPGSAKYAPKLNVSAARAAIGAAGAAGPYTLLTANDSVSTAAAEVIQAELAQVGMQVDIVSKSLGDFIAQLNKGDFDMALIGHQGFDADVMYSFFDSSQRNAGLNWINTTDPGLDKLLVAGRTTLNWTKAKADYFAAQKLLDTKVYVDPLWVSTMVYAARSRVQGMHLDAAGDIQYQDLWVK
jgi:peptide/nickel transport system substrate-binding protein